RARSEQRIALPFTRPAVKLDIAGGPRTEPSSQLTCLRRVCFVTISGMTPSRTLRARTRRIVTRLATLYPDAHCELDFGNPLQLLIATILSAQCTDVRVNMVTPALFARYPDAAAYAKADSKELEELIRSTGFYRAKARNIQLCCRQLVERHG